MRDTFRLVVDRILTLLVIGLALAFIAATISTFLAFNVGGAVVPIVGSALPILAALVTWIVATRRGESYPRRSFFALVAAMSMAFASWGFLMALM